MLHLKLVAFLWERATSQPRQRLRTCHLWRLVCVSAETLVLDLSNERMACRVGAKTRNSCVYGRGGLRGGICDSVEGARPHAATPTTHAHKYVNTNAYIQSHKFEHFCMCGWVCIYISIQVCINIYGYVHMFLTILSCIEFI